MKATARIVVHLGNQSRFFEDGEEIPPDWAAQITNPSVVDEVLPHLVAEAKAAGREAPGPDPFAGLRRARTVEDVLTWVNDPEAPADRLARAQHALEVETEGRHRPTLMATLRELIADLSAPAPTPEPEAQP